MAGTWKTIGPHVIRTVLLSVLLSSTETSTTRLTDVPVRCYSCTSTETASQCETNPPTLPHSILDCPADRHCTIVRVEEWPSRRVKSFYRGCDGRTRVFERNNCQIEKDERTCFTACVGDLCNLGDGLVVVDDTVRSVASAGYEPVNRARVFLIGSVLVTFSLGRLV